MQNNKPESYLTGSEYGRNTPHEVELKDTRKRTDALARNVEPTGARSVKSNYRIQATDRVILVDAAPAAVRITLPKTTEMFRRTLIIKKIDASVNTVTIEPNRGSTGTERIDGATTLVLTTQNEGKSLYAGEGAWWVLADH